MRERQAQLWEHGILMEEIIGDYAKGKLHTDFPFGYTHVLHKVSRSTISHQLSTGSDV